jgi:hypothetical protein
MSIQQTEVGVLRVYGCGGGGINIASKFAGNLPLRAGIADIRTAFVDTSRTNLSDKINPEDCYVLPDLDGSGKVRKENHEAIAKEIPRILIQHQPGDFNIVAFTASGGTGSVAGPLLVAELMERGHNVIAVVIGSEESAITATNTFNTLKSLDHISRSKDKPVLMHYTLNHRDMKRSEVDKEAVFVISALAYLSSRQNKELDTKDITHWMNFNKSTSINAQLSMLKVFNQANLVEEGSPECFSLACLLKSEDEGQPNLVPAYSCAGYYREGVDAPHNLFFAVETRDLNGILSHLQKTSKTLSEHKAARIDGPSFMSNNDQVSATGLIL